MDTDFNAIANFINDCFMYLPDTIELKIGSKEYSVYQLLSLAEDICKYSD